MYLKELRNQNPWWHKTEWQEKDKHLRDFYRNKIKWFPSWLDEVSLKPFSLNFIIGPRQVGKTTGIKLLIKKLIEDKKISEENILYVNCEILPDFISLRKTLLEFLNETKKAFIFLDEVTSLKDWWKAVKSIIDVGIAERSVICVTGSSSLKLKRHAEFFPGRKGKGKEITVFPLNFQEYVKIMKENKIKKDIKEFFKDYINTGGFALTINGFSESEILASFIGEFVRNDLSLEIAKETFASVISKIPSAMSFHAIASETSGYSYKTIQQYLEVFRNLFILEFAYLKRKKIEYRKEKKIFFLDPLLLKLFSYWSNSEFLKSALMENIVQAHLYRKFGEIYYYRNRYEIDCIAGNMKVEVKAGKPYRKYPKGVKIVDEDNLPEFLLGLGK